MSASFPPIIKLVERLLLDIEQAVIRFPRRHKYAVGAELRAQALKTAQMVHRAWHQRERQAYWVSELRWEVDNLKIVLQLAKELHAFTSFGQFEALIRLAREVGKQVGGWHRQQQHQHPKGPNAPATNAAAARPDTEYRSRLAVEAMS